MAETFRHNIFFLLRCDGTKRRSLKNFLNKIHSHRRFHRAHQHGYSIICLLRGACWMWYLATGMQPRLQPQSKGYTKWIIGSIISIITTYDWPIRMLEILLLLRQPLCRKPYSFWQRVVFATLECMSYQILNS